VGYKFVQGKSGVCNGNFLGVGADDCQRAVLVEHSAPMGLLITNGEFVSFHGPDPTMLEVAPTHAGSVRLVNCAFWGPCQQIARVAGKGTVGFSDCTFVEWDRGRDGRAALQIDDGTVLVQGCEFRQAKALIALAAAVRRAVITGNVFSGPAQIANASQGSVQIGLNAESP
jgi:hypothetical protein